MFLGFYEYVPHVGCVKHNEVRHLFLGFLKQNLNLNAMLAIGCKKGGYKLELGYKRGTIMATVLAMA